MPYTVAVSFDVFYDNINLRGDQRAIANSRRENVISKLSKDFEIVESFSTGSIPKMTALQRHADLDVMVALNWKKHVKGQTPTQVLQNIRNSLAEWSNSLRRDGQAITLRYKTWPNVDIVPVYRSLRTDGTVSHYNVPNSYSDSWIKSRPKELAAVIEAKAASCGRNFRRIIKMLKHWNRVHGDYLTGYHIEILAIKVLQGNCDDVMWEIYNFFKKSKELLKGPLYYDTGVADDYLTYGNRHETLKRFDTAIALSLIAWSSTYSDNNDHETAIGKWRQIFGDEFPEYAS